MKSSKTPQQKFKAGLKKSGYDPDAGAKRLLDLIAKQKKEREEFESKYKSAYEGKEMKTLSQILEGTVVMSDFKLDKKGRKYKAHRASMGRDDMTNEGRAEDAFADLDKEIENKDKPTSNKEKEQGMSSDLQKFRDRSKSGKSTKLSDMNPLDREQWEKEKKDAGVKEEVEQVDEVSKETVSGYNKKAMAYIKNYKYSNNPPSVRRKLENRFSGVERADERLKGSKPTSEEVEQVDELKKSTLRSYLKKAVPSHGDQEFISRAARDPEEKAAAKRTAGNRATGIIRANKGLKSAHVATMKEDTNPYDLDEARGRPAGAATLAKRAAAAAKPREDDDEGEHYDADSGVEADQHIHVQLKKAADSDQKPFEVSFKNGKKHTVSQKVAKDVLAATERLKPEHRKNVHDEIHQSYDNLVSVHRLVAGR